MISQLSSSPSIWFTIPALVGTVFFALRLAMALMGLDFAEGADGDGGGFGDLGDDAVDLSVEEGIDHAETTSVFKFLSIQTVTSFAMGFGLGGLMALHTLGLGIVPASLVAIAIGFAFAWFIVWLLKMMYAMESSGNVSIKDAIGAEGTTTSTIPAKDAPTGNGVGRVRITVGDRQRAYAARSEGDAITMGARIRVVHVNSDNTVTVSRI